MILIISILVKVHTIHKLRVSRPENCTSSEVQMIFGVISMKSSLQRFTILKDDHRNPPIPSVQNNTSCLRNDNQWTFFHFPHCGIQKPSIVMINKSDSFLIGWPLSPFHVINMWDQFCLSQTKLVSGPVSNRYAIIPEPVLRGAVIQLP